MNRLLILVVAALGIFELHAQNTQHVSNLEEQLKRLEEVDSLLLEYLPDTFEEYYALCGNSYSPLYHYEDIINHLYYSRSRTIDRKRLIEKIVSLSVGGVYYADHIAELHQVAVETMRWHTHDIVSYLNKLSERENEGYWQFIFGGIENRRLEYEDVAEVLSKQHQYKYYSSIKAGYNNSIVHTH